MCCRFNNVVIDKPSLLLPFVSCRMTLGVSNTPTPCSRPWVTCCASGMACTPPLAWLTCGSPSSAWLWGPPASPCLWVMRLRSFSLWIRPGGSTKKRWVFLDLANKISFVHTCTALKYNFEILALALVTFPIDYVQKKHIISLENVVYCHKWEYTV